MNIKFGECELMRVYSTIKILFSKSNIVHFVHDSSWFALLKQNLGFTLVCVRIVIKRLNSPFFSGISF